MKTKDSIQLRRVKKLLSSQGPNQCGKWNVKSLMNIWLFTTILYLFVGIISDIVLVKTLWFVSAAISFSNFTTYFMTKGFLEYVDEMKIKTSNQKVELTENPGDDF